MPGNSIEIDGKEFAIDGELSLEYYSPFIDAEEIVIKGDSINPRGNYTLPFSLKGTPELADTIKHAQLLSSTKGKVAFTKNVLRSEGATIERGNVDINRIPRNLNNDAWTAESIFYNNGALFADVVKNKTLKDLVLHGEVTITGNSIRSMLDELHSNYPIHFLIHLNGDGTIGTIESYRGHQIWSYFYRTYAFDYFQDTHAYANYILQGIEPADHSIANAPALGWFCFPSYRADWENVSSETLHNLFNHYTGNTMVRHRGYSVAVADPGGPNEYAYYIPLRNQVVPMYYYHKVLRNCFSEFGYELKGDLLDDEDFQKLILPNTYSILKEEVLLAQNAFNLGNDLNLLYCQNPTVINPKNHLPDMSIIDFVRDFMLKFNVFLKFEGNTVTVSANKFDKAKKQYEQLNPEVIIEGQKLRGISVKYNFNDGDGSYETQTKLAEDFETELPEDVDGSIVATLADGDNYLMEARNVIRRKDSSTADGFKVVVNNLVRYFTGQEKEFTSEITPVEMGLFTFNPTTDPGSPDSNWQNSFFPWFKHAPTYYDLNTFTMNWLSDGPFDDEDEWGEVVPSSENLNTGEEEKKIAIYHGLQKTDAQGHFGTEYPYMSFHNYAPGALGDADVKLSAWHLGWLGDEGLIVTFWKSFINMFNVNRKVTFKLFVTWDDIRTHDWQSAYIINGKKYYVSAIKFSVPGLLHGQPAVYECWEL